MNERTVFLTALEKADPAERSAYLDDACADNLALRERVESLLRSHERAGAFLNVPAVEQLAAPGLGQDRSGDTQEVASNDDGQSLEFLAPSDRPGSLGRLHHYEIQEVIGRGGMGIVLRAFDEKLHRVVAIKVMAAQLATNATARKRFTREAQAQAAISHDHVVTIYAVEEASAQPFFVMQYVAGFSLQQRLDRDGPLELPEILRIGMQAASALAAAHAQGLVHRDIKPANILLENGVERVKVTDFGLARARAEASLTQSGVVAGTPQFMSPEQARGDAVDQRTDLFSLGSVLYAMCTGRAPFRASSSLAVLKRVCEETPAPIRDVNPDIPDWLVAIVARLHAKEPAERFQSAAEVAALLGRHLAHVQHPSVVGQVSNLAAEPKANLKPALRRRLAFAAAVLVCLIAGLSFTEATGVTNLRATVIRIFTPDGTLVVEIDDPGVKVTVEGDGGLVITGASLEEIRLRPGSYKIQADKDGKRVPLERELVSIAKGGREVVKVKLEASAQASAKAEKGMFVLLAAGKERKYDTLAKAVQNATDGDTIEVRGNGPFVSEPIKITSAITIRAAAGSRPVISLSAEASQAKAMIEADAPLVLEGLELRRLYRNEMTWVWQHVIVTSKALHAANCRFVTRNVDVHIAAWGIHPTELRNCEFLTPATFSAPGGIVTGTFAIHLSPGRGLVLDNCLLTASVITVRRLADPKGAVFRLTHNTCRNPRGMLALTIRGDDGDAKNFAEADWTVKAFEVQASDNVFNGDATFVFGQQYVKAVVPPGEAEPLLARMVGWQGERNVYTGDGAFLSLTRLSPTVAFPPPKLPAGLAGWKQFWGTIEERSVEGRVRFQGGDLLAKAESALEEITPADFRLRADSAGYRAGKDGKDLGADVDLVGPGPAYERWKQTPEYQQWLKETGQIKPEAKAFVLLRDKGIEVRKFDTLAEAVQGASAGDTIEIRGNGPFDNQPITIDGRALTIRAAKGFQPVLRIRATEGGPVEPLLETNAPLVLEGLALERLDEGGPAENKWRGSHVLSRSAPLHVLHCRFKAGSQRIGIVAYKSPVIVVRNCEFSGPRSHWGMEVASCDGPADIANCLFAVTEHGVAISQEHGLRKAVIRLGHCTIGAFTPLAYFTLPQAVQDATKPPPGLATTPIRVEMTANTYDRGRDGIALHYQHFGEKMDVQPLAEAVVALPRMLSWQEMSNLYSESDAAFLRAHRFVIGHTDLTETVRQFKTLAEWSAFWGIPKNDSAVGQIRYMGGKSRFWAGREQITPEDFRLRPDSPGYRAGKDGKDLGADVDLVGPGPAYERWKKTPEYQQWLKDTGQIKPEAPKPEAQAFALMGGKGVAERRFDTLAEAVLGASDGDTIQVRGNGPFVSQPIEIRKRALVIRAGAGFRPVIRLSPEGAQANAPLLTTSAALVLEGLELQRESPPKTPVNVQHFVHSQRARLHVLNCRFLVPRLSCIWVLDSPLCVVRNCELLSFDGVAVGGRHPPGGGQWIMDNCLQATGTTLYYLYQHQNLQDASIQLTRNSSAAKRSASLSVQAVPTFPETGPAAKPSRLEASETILDADAVMLFNQAQASPLPPAEAETLLARLLDWQGRGNLYGDNLLAWGVGSKLIPPHGPQSLADWKQFWKSSETGSLQGRVRFQGGDLLSRVATAPETITPEDFRLRPDSAGYRAGKDGKDLGADVHLVGPGPAYERWRKTPEYQQWLKDTGQKK